VVDAIQRAIVAPQVEIIKKRAARWQVLRDRTPLAPRAQNIHDPVYHFAHIDVALVAAALGWRDQQLDKRPFIVGQITRISQFAAIVPRAILRRPHLVPPESATTLESQAIHVIQDDFGQTLTIDHLFRQWLRTLPDGDAKGLDCLVLLTLASCQPRYEACNQIADSQFCAELFRVLEWMMISFNLLRALAIFTLCCSALPCWSFAEIKVPARHGLAVRTVGPDGRPARGPQNEAGSPNWSGYVLTGGIYQQAQATWTVPTPHFVDYSQNPSSNSSSTWVGIGGDIDGTLIQLGTYQGQAANGQTTYYAWFELLPADEIIINYPVNPGDVITAALNCYDSCRYGATQSWELGMTNHSQGWVWRQNVSYSSALASVEWIMEAPTINGIYAPLPNYGSVTFTGALINNGPSPTFTLPANGS
jgi:Peptidase A4 family